MASDAAYYEELIGTILKVEPDKRELAKLKNNLCSKHKLKKIPTDIQVLMHADSSDVPQLKKFLVTKPTRSISGVSVVAIMTKPFNCPHGTCTYCPGGPDSPFNSPKSYTGHEPATMRGLRNNYDSYLQVMNRLEQYIVTGHLPQKIEIIIMGGTFPGTPNSYQNEFIRYAYKALNDFSDMFFIDRNTVDIEKFREFFELPGSVHDDGRATRIKEKLIALRGECTLEEQKQKNESVHVRCVALCIETKPDFSRKLQINRILEHGATRVEIGIQTLDDEILAKVNRGHDDACSREATQLLKDSFLKVGYHMMPGLPGSTVETDKQMLHQLFTDADYRPDALKIYPCLVIKGTQLYDEWKRGEFEPMTTQVAAQLIADVKDDIPLYCRLMRVQRDIPTKVTSAGVDRTNLRQYVDKINPNRSGMREREAGHVLKNTGELPEQVELTRIDYESSGGKDIFIAAEDVAKKILIGFARLRIPGKPFRPEITPTSAGVRQLHVFGKAVGLGKDAPENAFQHSGWGEKLLFEAERIAKEEYSCDKMLVISGIGVREYYKKRGYAVDGVYMSKPL